MIFPLLDSSYPMSEFKKNHLKTNFHFTLRKFKDFSMSSCDGDVVETTDFLGQGILASPLPSCPSCLNAIKGSGTRSIAGSTRGNRLHLIGIKSPALDIGALTTWQPLPQVPNVLPQVPNAAWIQTDTRMDRNQAHKRTLPGKSCASIQVLHSILSIFLQHLEANTETVNLSFQSPAHPIRMPYLQSFCHQQQPLLQDFLHVCILMSIVFTSLLSDGSR